jgi:polar amino acid transport system substrate-binding protein
VRGNGDGNARITWGVMAAVLVASASACAGGGDAGREGGVDRVRSAGVLRWGGDRQGGEPYVFEDPQRPAELVGFEVEIAAALARHLGVRPVFVQNDWPTLVPSLERGTFDVVLNGLETHPALAERVALSRPYYLFTERLVARAGDHRVRDRASLRGRRVGTLAGSQAWRTLLAAGADAVPYDGVNEPFLDLAAGRTDAVLLDDIIVSRYAPRHPRLEVVGDIGEGRYVAATRRDEDDLRAAIDDALGRMVASGELGRILGHWGLDNPRQAALAAQAAQAAPAAVPAGPAAASAPPHRQARLRAGTVLLFLKGALITLLVSLGAMVLAVPLGLALALARLYWPRGRWAAAAYVELFRGTPVLLQLYLLYFGLAPVLRLDAFGAAVLGLGLNYAAYESEIHRAGIAAVPVGQMEAALSLGMTRALALRRVVLPQAARVALPGMANDFIALLKDSSLVSVITVVELTKRMTITAVDTGGWLLPGLLCAGLYLVMSYPLARLARRLERRLGGR